MEFEEFVSEIQIVSERRRESHVTIIFRIELNVSRLLSDQTSIDTDLRNGYNLIIKHLKNVTK